MAELRTELSARGLSSKGTRKVLLKRLQMADEQQHGSAAAAPSSRKRGRVGGVGGGGGGGAGHGGGGGAGHGGGGGGHGGGADHDGPGLMDLDDDSLDALVSTIVSTVFCPAASFNSSAVAPGMVFKYGRLGMGHYADHPTAGRRHVRRRPVAGATDKELTDLLISLGTSCRRMHERVEPVLALMRVRSRPAAALPISWSNQHDAQPLGVLQAESAAWSLNKQVNTFECSCEALRNFGDARSPGDPARQVRQQSPSPE